METRATDRRAIVIAAICEETVTTMSTRAILIILDRRGNLIIRKVRSDFSFWEWMDFIKGVSMEDSGGLKELKVVE